MSFHQNPNGWLAYNIEPRQLRTALCPGRRPGSTQERSTQIGDDQHPCPFFWKARM